MQKKIESSVEEDHRYHNTWKLLKNYRDVVWSMELSVEYIKNEFEIEFETDIDSFLESAYCAGADLGGTRLEQHTRTIERSNAMLKLVNRAVELLRTKHKYGEKYYWILYYAYLSPQQIDNFEETLALLRPHIQDISKATYYRMRKKAVEAMSSILWGYSTTECNDILEEFFPNNAENLRMIGD